MAYVTVTHDLDRVQVFLDELAKQAIKKAVATSIRRTFPVMKKNLAKEISSKRLYNPRSLTQSDIKKRYLVERIRASAGMAITDMEARIDVSKHKPSLMHFWAKRIPVYRAAFSKRSANVRRTRAMGLTGNKLSGVQVTVMGKTYTVRKAFMPGASGVRQVFMRTTVKRLPIRSMKGPTFVTMFQKMGILPVIQRGTQERYAEEFERNFNFFLKQLTERQAAKGIKG